VENNFNVAPNLKQHKISLISSLSEQASYHYIQGHLELWFNHLRNIKLKIGHKMSKEERELLSNKEKRINRFLPKYKSEGLNTNKNVGKYNNKLDSILCPLIEDYEIELNRILERVSTNKKDEDNGY